MTSPSLGRLLCALAVCFLLASCCVSAPPRDARKVTVTGAAVIKIVPDEMNWTVNVSISDATLAAAKARHDASLTSTLNYLRSLGASVKNLQTGGIRFDKNQFYNDDAEARKNPFSCSTQVTFTLSDFEKYGAICDAMVKYDGVQVQTITYTTSKQEATKAEALKQALLNAREKASALATTANCGLGEPLQIQEGTIDNSPQMMHVIEDQGPAPRGGTPNAVVAQIEISSTVTATYELTPK